MTLLVILLNRDHEVSFGLKLYFFVEYETQSKFLRKYGPLQNHKIQQARCLNPNFYFGLSLIKLKTFSKIQIDIFES